MITNKAQSTNNSQLYIAVYTLALAGMAIFMSATVVAAGTLLSDPANATVAAGTITTLPNGRLLVIGSNLKIESSKQAVVQDARGTATPTKGLHIARAHHTATMLPNGKVLILGGLDAAGQLVTRAELFNVGDNSFRFAEGTWPNARAGHSVTVLTNGRLLITGGWHPQFGNLYESELFDLNTGHRELLTAELHPSRYGHSATLLADGRVLMLGGYDEQGRQYQGATLFDPQKVRFLDVDRSSEEVRLNLQNLLNPVLAESIPAPESSNFPHDGLIALRFSKPLRVATVNEQTITLLGPQGVTAIEVVPAEDGRLAFISPKQDLFPGVRYNFFINGPVDQQGQALPFFAMAFNTAAHRLAGPADSRIQSDEQAEGHAQTGVERSPNFAGLQPDNPQRVATTTPNPTQWSLNNGEPRIAEPKRNLIKVNVADDERWQPGTNNRGGKWRTGKPLPDNINDRRNDAMSAIAREANARNGRLRVGATLVSGVVLKQNDKPLVNVRVSIGTNSTRTDSAGEFTIANVPPGQQELLVDGSGEGNGIEFGRFVIGVNVEANRENPVAPIFLPKINKNDWIELPSPLTADTIVRTPDVPGMEIHIPKGTVLRDREGKIVTKIALIPMPLDRSPFPFPENAPVYVSVQPGGMVVQGLTSGVTPGIRVIYPNQTDAKPSERVHFWAYSTSGRGWHIYGQGAISMDGKQVVPDDGVALYESVGFMYTDTNPPPPEPPPPPCEKRSAGGSYAGGSDDPGAGSGGTNQRADIAVAGDSTDCKTGLFVLERPDIRVRGLMPINLSRVYRPGDPTSRAFGLGTTHYYAMYLREVSGTPARYQQYDLIRADGSVLRYIRTSVGFDFRDMIAEHTTSGSEFYKTRLAFENGYYVITQNNGTKLMFSLFGTMQRIEDRFGNQIEVIRVGGEVVSLINSSGRGVSIAYDTSSRIVQITDSALRIWNYEYSAEGYLSKAIYPDGLFELYTYDAVGRMLTVTDRKGVVTVTNEYDANGRIAKQTMPGGAIYQFAYTLDAGGAVTQSDVTDPRGNIRRVTYHPLGYVASETLAFGTSVAQTVTYERDATNGLRTAVIDALGRRFETVRDARGNVLQSKGLVGTADAYTTTYTYTTDFNLLATVTDPRGQVTSNTYDTLGRLTKVTDPLGHSRTFTYNAAGQVLTETDGLNNTTTFSYDFGDLRSVTDPLNRTTTIFNDILGRVVSVTDPLGRRAQVERDIMGRVVKTIDPFGQTTTITYDANGNRLTVTNPKTQTITWGYDASNRNTSRKDALNQTESFTYDFNGNVVSYTDRRALTRTFTYDALDRRTQTVFAGGATVTNTFDAGNRNTQITDSISGTITRAYDARDRLTSETTPQDSVSYTYDIASRRTAMTVTGQPAVTYGYDDANRLVSITQNGKTTTSAYDNANRLTQNTLGNGVSKNYLYDFASQLTSLTFKNGPVTLGDLTYTYDAAGQIITQAGSFARTTLPAATTTNAVYDANNRLTSWNGQAITYDANGNMLTRAGKTYSWDTRNRLTTISGTTPASFSYDSLDRRISKAVPLTSNIATQLTYDGSNPVTEKQGALVTGGNLTGLGIDTYLARTDGLSTTYPLTDHLGSTVALTDATGALVTSYTYEPYGATTITGSTSNNPHQYTGREDDGTGLYFYRARYYDPQLMRFISEDPIGLAGGVNSYAYVGGNPVMHTDPDGLHWIRLVFAVGGAALAGYSGYQLGQEYGNLQCKTNEKFDNRATNTDRLPEMERIAGDLERARNLITTAGPVVIRGGMGVLISGVAGGTPAAGISFLAGAGGFAAGYSNCTCQR